MTTQLATKKDGTGLPPILAGNMTPDIRRRVDQFYISIASIFEAWVSRRQSRHTQRAYREDVMAFVKFMEIGWPDQAIELLRVSVKDVVAFRDQLLAQNAAPKTLNRRISSLSSFFKYLAAAAAELRLPITVPNPAHAQFISRESTDAREERRALSATRARQLMGLPAGNQRVSQDRLLKLWKAHLVNRFAFPGIPPSEFIYYLDNRAAPELLAEHRGLEIY